MNLRHLQKGKLMFALVLISIISFSLSCKKDNTEYQISYTGSKISTYTWYSDDVSAVIRGDSLLLTGQKDDKSSIALIVYRSAVGNYEMSTSDLKTVVVIDKEGLKERASQYISVEGVVSIIEKNEDKKTITGSFDVEMINLASIDNKERFKGNFTSKYQNY